MSTIWLVDLFGLLDKMPFQTAEAAHAKRKELNARFNCHGRFQIKAGN